MSFDAAVEAATHDSRPAADAAPPGETAPDPAVVELAIRKQVEFYFSDANLPTDKHLLKLIGKDPDGYVPIKAIAGFKRVKALSKDIAVLTAALRASTELAVSDDGKRVRRATPLPAFDVADIQRRTVLVEHLPDGPTIASVTEMFKRFGTVRMVRIGTTGANSKLPQWLLAGVTMSSWGHQQFALVEFNSEEDAVRAVDGFKNPDNWRTSLHVRHLLRQPPKPAGGSSAAGGKQGAGRGEEAATSGQRGGGRTPRRGSETGEGRTHAPGGARKQHSDVAGGDARSSQERWQHHPSASDGAAAAAAGAAPATSHPLPLLTPIRTAPPPGASSGSAAEVAARAAVRGLGSPSPGSPGGAAAGVARTPTRPASDVGSPARGTPSPLQGTPPARVASLIDTILSGLTNDGASSPSGPPLAAAADGSPGGDQGSVFGAPRAEPGSPSASWMSSGRRGAGAATPPAASTPTRVGARGALPMGDAGERERSLSPSPWVPSHRRTVAALVDGPVSPCGPARDASGSWTSSAKPPTPRSGSGSGRTRRQSWHASTDEGGGGGDADDTQGGAVGGSDMRARIDAIRELSFELDPAVVAAAMAAVAADRSRGATDGVGVHAAGAPPPATSDTGDDVDVGAAEGGEQPKRRRNRRRSNASRRQSLDATAPTDTPAPHHHGGGGGGEGEAKTKAAAPKQNKKNYAAWAAATPEFRAVATAARHPLGGASVSGSGTPPLGSTPPGASFMPGSSPSRMSPIMLAAMGGGAGAVPSTHDALAHVPRMPDGTRGFSMGRGRVQS